MVIFEDSVSSKISLSLYNKLLDPGYWTDLELLCSFLNYFTIGFKLFEGDTPNLSKVYHWFVLLPYLMLFDNKVQHNYNLPT